MDPRRLQDGEPGGRKGGAERADEEGRACAAVLQALRHAQVTTPVAAVHVQREPFHRQQTRVDAFAAGRFPRARPCQRSLIETVLGLLPETKTDRVRAAAQHMGARPLAVRGLYHDTRVGARSPCPEALGEALDRVIAIFLASRPTG